MVRTHRFALILDLPLHHHCYLRFESKKYADYFQVQYWWEEIWGQWFFRIVLFNDPPVGDPIVCDTSDPTVNPDVDTDGDGILEVCLAGDGSPSSNFLIDTVDPLVAGTTLPVGEREVATGKVTLKQPLDMKEDVFIPAMEALLALPPDDQKSVKDLDKAILEMNKSTNPGLWVDDLRLITGTFMVSPTSSTQTGKDVIQAEGRAEENLMKLLGLPITGKKGVHVM